VSTRIRRRSRRINDVKFHRLKRLTNFNVDAVPATLTLAGTPPISPHVHRDPLATCGSLQALWATRGKSEQVVEVGDGLGPDRGLYSGDLGRRSTLSTSVGSRSNDSRRSWARRIES
jgi:hypothetical protein